MSIKASVMSLKKTSMKRFLWRPVKQRKVIGGPAPEIVAAHIEHVKAIQKEMDADEID